mmetsp:Transcript_61919/g.147709  ORF Transcript_61919/g.147709 Transcript_61919/m.147709 type:complete len:284 (+) Transcript_61919:364-1215(+)
MVALISKHAFQHVHPHRIFLELPVDNRQLRGWQVVPLFVERCPWGFHLANDVRIGQAGSFLKVANKAMHCLWFDNVNGCQERCHDYLRSLNKTACHQSSLKARHADKEVHPFILRLLQEGVNPAVISLQSAERSEVAEHCAKEPRHSCHALQHNQPPLHGTNRCVHRLEASDPVESAIKTPHRTMHEAVPPCHGPMLPKVPQALLHLLLTPDVVGDAVPKPPGVFSLAIVAQRLCLQWVGLRGLPEVSSSVAGSPCDCTEGRGGHIEWCRHRPAELHGGLAEQ